MPSSELDRQSVTQLLHAWRGGDSDALSTLMPKVYDQLRQIAVNRMRSERANHTLQATALVHETFERLLGVEANWADRAHFLAMCARVMRRVLTDHSRGKGRAKRGGHATLLSLDEGVMFSEEPSDELLDLDEAIQRLAQIDDRKARLVEMHFFGGLTYDEMAEATETSAATVHRELRFAKAWLLTELSSDTE